MVKFTLKYVVKDQDRHGNIRFYFRQKGQKKIRLKGEFGSKEFMTAYQLALSGYTSSAKAPPQDRIKDSLRYVCEKYYLSQDFNLLDSNTQKWRRSHLDRICSTKGSLPMEHFTPFYIKQLRDEIIKTPAASRNRLNALKAVFSWAFENNLITHNATIGIKARKYKSDGIHTWSDEEFAKFIDRHPLGTKAYLAVHLLLFTGGRREDAVRLGPQHIKGGIIKFTQAKNEHKSPVVVEFPVHHALQNAIDHYPSGHLTFLVNEYGRPFTPAGFGNKMREWCDQAELPQCSAHGLRKRLASLLAESGCTVHEVQAITGHRTSNEVDRYTKAADKKRLGLLAIKKIK